MKKIPATRTWRKSLIILTAILLGCNKPLTPSAPSNSSKPPKNIIMIIGDGMGPQQIALAELYHNRIGGSSTEPLHRFITTATHGTHLPLPETALVNDSACAASQLAGGCRCDPQSVGLDRWGKPCETISRRAQKLQMRVGLVSDTRLSHATPAGFAARAQHRDQESEIALQMIESRFDLMLSGGREHFSDSLLARANELGYRLVSNRSELSATKSLPVLGLFSKSHMLDAFQEGSGGEPTLAQMTDQALKLLDGSRGFFLMIEAGQIDTAAHHNDAGWVLREMFRLSSVLDRVLRFTSQRDDTLVILTADHETGGLGLSYRGLLRSDGGKTADFLAKQTLIGLARQRAPLRSYLNSDTQALEKLSDEVKRLGIDSMPESELLKVLKLATPATIQAPSDECQEHHLAFSTERFYPHPNYRAPAILGRELGARLGVVWATGGHTSTPVPIMCHGVGKELCRGWFSTQSFGKRLINAPLLADPL